MELQKLIDGLKNHRNGADSYESVDEAIRVFEAMRDVDGEKVCKGLEQCEKDVKLCFGETKCEYERYFPKCWTTLAHDALALIRQQQERIAELDAAHTAKGEEPVAEGVWSWYKPAYAQCSSCKKKSYLGWKDPYCRYCGAKMMFEPPKEEEHEQ